MRPASATPLSPSLDVEPESALLERLRRGDPDAAGEFFDRYAARISRFIAQTLGGSLAADSEDLLQETLIALAESLPYFRGDSSLFTFACAIAHRKTSSHIRKVARRARLATEAGMASQPHDDPGADLELHRAFDRLDSQSRKLLFLKYVEELNVAEIAAIVDMSEHAVESRLARARRALKKLLEAKA